MNWNDIGTQIILSVVGILITALGTMITYLINKHIKNDEVKEIIKSLYELVKASVLEVQQTYVDEMKSKEIFDKNAQKIAIEKCLETINKNMPIRVKGWLEANYEDINNYLRTLIEAQIKLLKIGG